jgi:hypothetical protein
MITLPSNFTPTGISQYYAINNGDSATIDLSELEENPAGAIITVYDTPTVDSVLAIDLNNSNRARNIRLLVNESFLILNNQSLQNLQFIPAGEEGTYNVSVCFLKKITT